MARAPLLRPLHLLVLAALTPALTGEESCPRTPGPQSTVARLKENLLKFYFTDEPPPTQGGPVAVEHAVLIKHVPGIYTNVADIQITVALTWEDSRLQWSPDQYDNLRTILIDSNNIWVPFLGIQGHPTSVPDSVYLEDQMCVVASGGAVICMAGAMVEAHCLSDYRDWPQDRHNCSFHIASWLHTSDQLFLKDFHLGMAMSPDGPWLEQQHGFSTTNSSVGPDGRLRSASTVWLLLAHQQGAMAVAAYSSAVGLAALTLSALWLPATCGERQALAATSVLAHCFLLGYFSWWLEGGARAPRIVLLHRDGAVAACATLLLLVAGGRLRNSRRTAPAWLTACLARLRQTPASALLLPPAQEQSEAPVADAPSAPDPDVEAPGGDASSSVNLAGSDALGAADTAASATTDPAAAPTASDAESWVAASVLVERLGRGGVCAALLAALLRLLLSA